MMENWYFILELAGTAAFAVSGAMTAVEMKMDLFGAAILGMTKAEIDAIARAGATWVTVVPTVWQDTCSSSFQYKDFALTPNDIELMDAIDLIHAKGMKVQLRPMLECKDGIGRLGVWMIPDRERMPGRATRERAKWFASMAARSAYYARIAERTKCEAFCLDSELDRMVEENDKWKAVIAAVRGVYSGPVTSCHTLHTGVVDFKKCLADGEIPFKLTRQRKEARLAAALAEAKAVAHDPAAPTCNDPDKIEEFMLS